MTAKSPATAADLLREAKRIEAQERDLKRARLALAKKLIETGQALGGDDLLSEKPTKPKRRLARRRRIMRSSSSPQSVRPSAEHQPRTETKKLNGRRFSDTGWTATMLKILTEANRPMTYVELKAAIAKTHLGPKLLRTEKSFYGSVGKLEDRKQAVRHGRRVSTTSVHERFMRDVAAGLVKDEPVHNSGGEHRSPVKTALLDFLEANSQGATIAEIIGNLEKRPELDLSDRNSKTAVYNLIARLVRREVLSRDGSVIRLPHRSNGSYHNEQSSTEVPSTH